MENASKALLIAGGVLIAILLLTLFSYLFGQMGASTSNIYEVMEKHEIAEFNQQFLNYEGRGVNAGTSPLTAQDVATLINLAQESEKNSKFGAKVEIIYGGSNIAKSQNFNNWLENNLNKKYKCKSIEIDNETLLVNRVEICDV